jgi:UDP-N-acetylglucosamine 1-carboxyvinyltransferase
MAHIIVRGGGALSGSVAASGSKNAALPIFCASLLNEQPVTLRNVPQLQDVNVIAEVLRSLGAQCERRADGVYAVNAGQIVSSAPPYELVNRMRASFLVLGPLLARFGEARVPLPGGCEIGARPVGEHLAVMRALGAEIRQEGGVIHARAEKLIGAEIHLNMPSVGATENAVMAAALAEGSTVIHNAALEPEVEDLCRFLSRCGVRIEGVGSKRISVIGQPRISAAIDYSIIPDRIEAGTYLLALVGTGGSGTVRCARPEHLDALLMKLREMGVTVDHGQDWISISTPRRLKPVQITTAVYPGFPTDLQPQITAVLTGAAGVSTVHETVFERRMTHVPELVRMGARIQLSGDTAVIEGNPAPRRDPLDPPGPLGENEQRRLSGAPVEAYDLRCAAALVIAGLMASGETRISGVAYLLRGYENMPGKIAELGGHIYLDDNQTSLPFGDAPLSQVAHS